LQLCAYVVGTAALDATQLRERLAAVLPDYMMPTAIMTLEALPLTRNGKLDRRALPVPVTAERYAADHVPPRGPAEALLARVWEEVLRVPRVGRHDNFLELGGDSILTLQVVARARKQGLALIPKQVMELQTIARIVAASAEQPARTTAESANVAALTPVQRWFFAQPLPVRQHWNQSVLLEVQALDAERLRGALRQLVVHHPALRLSFSANESGGWAARLSEHAASWQLDRPARRARSDRCHRAYCGGSPARAGTGRSAVQRGVAALAG
jgi:aryl carrier-like protein